MNVYYGWSINRIFCIGLKIFQNIYMEFNQDRISKYGNFNIESNIDLKWYYWSEDYYYSYDILIIDIQTDPNLTSPN